MEVCHKTPRTGSKGTCIAYLRGEWLHGGTYKVIEQSFWGGVVAQENTVVHSQDYKIFVELVWFI